MRNHTILVATSSAMVLVCAVPLLAFWTTVNAPVGPYSLPPVGFQVHDTVSSFLPQGGMILAVSESCPSCVERSRSFLSAVSDRQDRVLLVSVGSDPSPYGTALSEFPQASNRVLFLSATEMAHFTGITAVPTYVSVSGSGTVTGAGPSSVGWVKNLVDPKAWLSDWRKVFSKRW